MRWQYYQKVLATSLAAVMTIGAQAQFQHPLVLPGDGGLAYHLDVTHNTRNPSGQCFLRNCYVRKNSISRMLWKG